MINEYNDYNTSLSLLQGLQLSSVRSMGLLSSSVVLCNNNRSTNTSIGIFDLLLPFPLASQNMLFQY